MTEEMRTCRICGQQKPESSFRVTRRSYLAIKISYRTICRDCYNQQRREQRAENKVSKQKKLPQNIPRKYADEISTIWHIVGKNPFIWSTIEGKGDYNPGILNVLCNRSIIEKVDKSRLTGEIWRFTPNIANSLLSYFGEPNSDAETTCKKSIQDRQDTQRDHFRDLAKQRSLNIVDHNREQRYQDCIQYARELYQTFGPCSFSIYTARGRGLQCTASEIQILSHYGFIVATGHHKNVSLWRLTDKAIVQPVGMVTA